MATITAIIHVYQHTDDLYIVPLVRLTNGPWLETLPANRVAFGKADSLADLLADAQQTAGRVVSEAANAWHTSLGENLSQASAMCAVRWYEEGAIKVVPQHYQASSSTDDGGIGWYDILEAIIELPRNTPLKTLADNIQRCLRT